MSSHLAAAITDQTGDNEVNVLLKSDFYLPETGGRGITATEKVQIKPNDLCVSLKLIFLFKTIGLAQSLVNHAFFKQQNYLSFHTGYLNHSSRTISREEKSM